jgi:hypothetical protein
MVLDDRQSILSLIFQIFAKYQLCSEKSPFRTRGGTLRAASAPIRCFVSWNIENVIGSDIPAAVRFS